ncbi:hypothetical protein LTR53_011816 [Teratosphaeriaceae sp. CCFEE 6253]|nr:hypothetical protein LTR53_011816 [Teratosphaeriaceae sp. CCFEE 6253]
MAIAGDQLTDNIGTIGRRGRPYPRDDAKPERDATRSTNLVYTDTRSPAHDLSADQRISSGAKKVTFRLHGAVVQMPESGKQATMDRDHDHLWVSEFVHLDSGAETTMSASLDNDAESSATDGPGSSEATQAQDLDANSVDRRTVDDHEDLDASDPMDLDDEHESNSSALSDPPSDLDGEDSSSTEVDAEAEAQVLDDKLRLLELHGLFAADTSSGIDDDDIVQLSTRRTIVEIVGTLNRAAPGADGSRCTVKAVQQRVDEAVARLAVRRGLDWRGFCMELERERAATGVIARRSAEGRRKSCGARTQGR